MAASSLYQLMLLGRPDERVERIRERLDARLIELGVRPDAIKYVAETDAHDRDPAFPAIAMFCGYDGASDSAHPGIQALSEDSIVIIPVVSDLKRAGAELPDSIEHINAVAVSLPEQNVDRVTSLILESFHLLRRERRLFISYRRNDSEAAANQIYDALDARGFDVFIDTRTVPPAIDFQSELWHRLSDSDVVVLLDTKGFRESRWTTEELARANATNIQILHLLWPGQDEDSSSSFSFFYPLSGAAFSTTTPPSMTSRLEAAAVDEICDHAERLRARAIAARHSYLVDSFCDNARDRGLTPNLQPQRWIALDLPQGRRLAVVPMIGVPSAMEINHTFDAISQADDEISVIWVLYDCRGLLPSWLKHLDWLDTYLPTRAVRLASADNELRSILR